MVEAVESMCYNASINRRRYCIMTEIGKFLKKLRIDRGEVLLTMAQKLGVTPSFLSAVELGKKKMPYEWNLKIRSAYQLTPSQEETLDEAISASEKSIIIDFQDATPNAKKLAVSFARSFCELTDEQLKAIKKLMQSEDNK